VNTVNVKQIMPAPGWRVFKVSENSTNIEGEPDISQVTVIGWGICDEDESFMHEGKTFRIQKGEVDLLLWNYFDGVIWFNWYKRLNESRLKTTEDDLCFVEAIEPDESDAYAKKRLTTGYVNLWAEFKKRHRQTKCDTPDCWICTANEETTKASVAP
jgi:hypothetical protein